MLKILQDKVTFLAEIAEWPDEIDVARAEAAKERAEKRLASHQEEVDVKRAEYALKKSIGAAGYQAVGFIADFLKEYS